MKLLLAWIAALAVLLAAGLTLVRQHAHLATVRSAHAEARAALARSQATAPPSSGGAEGAVIAAPTVDEAALAAARDALARAEAQLAEAARASAPPAPSAGAVPPFSAGVLMPARAWQNAGNGSPEAALQTVLWAGAGGDITTLAQHLRYMTPQAQSAAEALYREVPEAAAKYRSPLELVAAMTVPDIPLASARVRAWQDATPSARPGADVSVRVAHLELYSSATPKTSTLLFIKEGGGWKLMLPEQAVARYAAQLKQGTAAAKAAVGGN